MRRITVVFAALTVAAGGVTGLAGLHALSAADDLQRASARLTTVHDAGTTAQQASAELDRARSQIAAAEHTLSRWPVDVLAAVPVLGRSWDAERAVTQAAREVVTGASVLAERLPTVRAGAGGVDLASLGEVRAALKAPAQRSEAALGQLRDTPVGWTPPQVRRGVTQAVAGLSPAVETLTAAHSGLGVVSGLLGGSGPRSVLIILQNNAELRGAGGYAATFATGRLEGGRLALDPLRDVAAAADPPARARRVPAPAEYAEDYSALSGDTTIWRSWNMSPHVPDSALVGARVAGELLEEQPDVVVLLDVPAMGALGALGGGTITLPDGSGVSPSELTEALLVDAYAEAGVEVEVQLQRRAELRAAATAVVVRLLAGDVPAAEAARTLRGLAAGRHLSVWSAREAEQEVLHELGLAGAVAQPGDSGDLSHVSVNNIGANKLDVYVDRDVAVDVVVGEERASVVQRVRFDNEAPEGLVPYVAGFERPGTVLSRVELSLPVAATSVTASVDGKAWNGTLRRGPSRQRLATRVELPRGASTVLEVRYELPLQGGAYQLRLLPQPLAEDASLTLSVHAVDGRRLGSVTGAERNGDAVAESARFGDTREISVSLADRSRWERLREFWNSPVQLG